MFPKDPIKPRAPTAENARANELRDAVEPILASLDLTLAIAREKSGDVEIIRDIQQLVNEIRTICPT